MGCRRLVWVHSRHQLRRRRVQFSIAAGQRAADVREDAVVVTLVVVAESKIREAPRVIDGTARGVFPWGQNRV